MESIDVRRKVMDAANLRVLRWRGKRVRVSGARLPFAVVYTDTADSQSSEFAGTYSWEVIAAVTQGDGTLGATAASL